MVRTDLRFYWLNTLNIRTSYSLSTLSPNPDFLTAANKPLPLANNELLLFFFSNKYILKASKGIGSEVECGIVLELGFFFVFGCLSFNLLSFMTMYAFSLFSVVFVGSMKLAIFAKNEQDV